MSDDVLSVVPADPYWQPDTRAVEKARELWSALMPEAEELRTTWHDHVQVIDCGGNLETISCPDCGGEVDSDWWADLISDRCEEGFDDLEVVVPCCGAAVSLNDLDYAWPVAFARFELEAWNPQRGWLTEAELSRLSIVIGHELRQIMAHI